MPSTNPLSRAVNIAQQSIRGAYLTGVLGVSNEPALTIGDWVRQFILAPPFSWRWNRSVLAFTCVAGQQDYSKSVPQFGWLEDASVTDTTNTVYELENVLNLSESTIQNLPTKICARLDDDNGNITFRLLPVPDQTYVVNLSFQFAARNFVSLADLWTPIPDYLSYLYNQGVLAKAYEYFNDERQGYAMQLFIRQLLAASTGLDQTQRNIFLMDQINSLRDEQSQLGNAASGRQARGV